MLETIVLLLIVFGPGNGGGYFFGIIIHGAASRDDIKVAVASRPTNNHLALETVDGFRSIS